MQVYKLTNETIDSLSMEIAKLYKSFGIDKKDVLRAQLLLEEALVKYKRAFGEDIEIYYKSYKVLSKTRFIIRIRCPEFDPFTLEENPMAFMLKNIMSNFESNVPTWTYKNFENEIVFTLKKPVKKRYLVLVGLSSLVCLVAGLIARFFFPQENLIAFVNDYLDPLSNAYAGLFCVMAVLLTLFAIALSIVHMGDINIVGKFGSAMVKRFYLLTIAFVLIFVIPILPNFSIGGKGEISIAVKSLYDILISFFPSNLVSPFLSFNPVHIMLIGAMFGFSFLSMGQRAEHIIEIFDECNLVAIYTNDFLNRFIFIYAGLKAFAITATSDFKALKSAGKMVLIILAIDLVLFLFYLIRTSRKVHETPKVFLKKTISGILVCLSSANFGSSASTIIDALLTENVDNDVLSIALNVGSIIYQPSCTLMFILSSLFMAKEFGVEISFVWIMLSIVLSIILVAAVPNIPGATVAALTLLYSQLGIPAEAISLMIAINAILQFITVAIDAWCLQSEVICLSEDYKTQKD